MNDEKKQELFKAYFKGKVNYMIDNELPNMHLDALRVKYEGLFNELVMGCTGECS